MAASITRLSVDRRPPGDFMGDIVNRLPDSLSSQVLSCLSLTALAAVCGVNRKWKEVASAPPLLKRIVYRDIAFGSELWTRCFNKGLREEEMKKYEYDANEFASLPSNIGSILKSPCYAFPGNRVFQTHMLVRLPSGHTINSFGKSAKKYFPGNVNGYKIIWDVIAKMHGDKSVDEPTWLLMTRGILPESRGKSYAEQQAMVAELATKSQAAYEVPTILEVVACIFAQYFSSSMLSDDPKTYIRLFSDSPSTFTRTIEQVGDSQVIVGGFAPSGLLVYLDSHSGDRIGIAARCRWKKNPLEMAAVAAT